MSAVIAPPHSVLLLVGREEYTPPGTFGGAIAVARLDCVAVGVLSADDGPTTVHLVPEADPAGLIRLGEFVIETEGLVSLRDVYGREYETVGTEPGRCHVSVWGNDVSEPDKVVFEIR